MRNCTNCEHKAVHENSAPCDTCTAPPISKDGEEEDFHPSHWSPIEFIPPTERSPSFPTP